MNRILIALLAAVSTAVMSEELRIVRLVDLDAPGALELVQREHPDHIIKIQRILREAPDQSPDEAPGWMRTQFGARGVGYGILKNKRSSQSESLIRTWRYRIQRSDYT